MDFKEEKTKDVIQLVNKIVSEKPDEFYRAVVMEDYKTSFGAFGTVSCWTSLICVYFDEERNRIKTITIAEHGNWQTGDTINYILYWKGIYKPRNDEDLKIIRDRYESSVDMGLINPINHIYSETYRMKKICEYILKNRESVPEPAKLTMILDYEFAENRTDMKYHKKDYSYRLKVEFNGYEFTTRHSWYTKASILLDKVYNELKNNGFDAISVIYDMNKEDKEKYERCTNSTNITF